MFIFVDESGSFVLTDKADAWCVVAAYVLPESSRKRLDALMLSVRRTHGNLQEVKLGNLSEDSYVEFLTQLRRVGGLAFAAAVNVSLHRHDEIIQHQRGQVEKIRERIDVMVFDEGKKAVAGLADNFEALPLQLYTQLCLQLELFHVVLKEASLYYVQRNPVSLANFRWRVDQKDRVLNRYEKTFRDILPAALQTKFLRDPMISLKGEDYSHFERFEYEQGKAPDHLSKVYGLDFDTKNNNVVNIGKVIREDFKYVDSTSSAGVQVADLLASGIRRVLRRNFDDVERVALALGANFPQPLKDEPTIRLISLDQTGQLDESAAKLIRLMARDALPMLKDH
ncbi:DUF3800 domain-containing protein [Burkholderia vietnamiensis]|uniref:DUF3800 domain-containing protein n=1 Tax=Burkholderia vietnamiensis TaxID=60552 RepID=UPI0026500CEA|nr:DUF3800 domain-containing protein [Burkholderia vietnamiensis]MDN8042981.1 DUF3800 domain-containing protein [Burkholderia vietnamiensis]HDR9134296.1 DUF3800 domain-containing protein [Burkholderia vietnamiensis]